MRLVNSYQVPLCVLLELLFPGLKVIGKSDVAYDARPEIVVRFMNTAKSVGVALAVVFSFTRKVNGCVGSARYGMTVPFARAIVGLMKGPMKIADGKTIPPTNKSFHVEFCTVATWNENGEITEERLFYDLVGLMRQIGLT